jgi:hypothetical protein
MVSGIIISFHEGLIRGSSLSSGKMADDRDTMKDVSHTAPNDTSAKAVWERGRGPVEEEEEEE